jgi:hypothetical protein
VSSILTTLSLDGDLLSDSGLSSGEISSDGVCSLDDDASTNGNRSLDDDCSSSDALSLDDNALSGDEISSDEEEDFEGEDDTDADLKDFIEQHEFLEQYAAAQGTKQVPKITKLETEDLLNYIKNPADREICSKDESIGELAFNLDNSGGQQPGSIQEQVSITAVSRLC